MVYAIVRTCRNRSGSGSRRSICASCPPKVWHDVQTKLKLIRKKSQRQRAAMRASGGRRNSYILSGILKCAKCGRSYTVCDSRRYKCSGASDKLCDNNLAVSRKRIEPIVLDAVQRELLSDDVLKLAQQEMRRLLAEERQRHANSSPKSDARRQLEDCQRRIDRLSIAVDATNDDIEEHRAVVVDLAAKKGQKQAIFFGLSSTDLLPRTPPGAEKVP